MGTSQKGEPEWLKASSTLPEEGRTTWTDQYLERGVYPIKKSLERNT
jgi:hypothetical protein